jgi:hypothetical protein
MGNDVAVESATSVLREDITNARVKDVNSIEDLDYPVKVAHAEVFYVGHGNDAGLQIGDEVVSWETVRGKLDGSPAVHHWVIACESNNILRPQDRRITAIPGEIDAVVSSHIALAIRDNALNQGPEIHLQKAMAHYLDIQNGATESLPLLLVNEGGSSGGGSSGGSSGSTSSAVWSDQEKIFAGIDFVIWFICTVASCAWAKSPITYAARAIKWILASKMLQIAFYLYRFAVGNLDMMGLMVSCFITIVSAAWTIISYLAWYIAAAITAIFTAQVTLGGPSLVFTLVISLALLGYWGYHVIRDYNDPDGDYQIHT